MFNADGSEGLMCGNGIRCLLRFGLDKNALKFGQVCVRYRDGFGSAECAPDLVGGADDARFRQHGSSQVGC